MARSTPVSRALSQNFLADRATAEHIARSPSRTDVRRPCCSKWGQEEAR